MREPYVTQIDANKNFDQSKTGVMTPRFERFKLPTLLTNHSIKPNYPYVIESPIMEIFSEAAEDIRSLDNAIVQKQAEDALTYLFYNLRHIDICSSRFHKLHVVKEEDESCLIEWVFSRFNAGLSFEPIEEQSHYFLVSVDESVGQIDTVTRRINGKIGSAVDAILRFVMSNI